MICHCGCLRHFHRADMRLDSTRLVQAIFALLASKYWPGMTQDAIERERAP